MTAPKSLPARPSLESLRKQAKAIARHRSVSLRVAQLILAREYGYAGWQDLTAEVKKRLGAGVAWAAAQARRVIHDNDVERLKELLAEYPALLSWHGEDAEDGLLGIATESYGDSFESFREQQFTRAACAELLIDAGAVVMPAVYEDLLRSRARELMQLFRRKGLLPRTLKFLAGLGDIDAVRMALDHNGNDPAEVTEAFTTACRFGHETTALLLLNRAIALDPELGANVDRFLLRHGANINTTWSSHEPASILHELVWHRNYEAMQFLIDRGIDMTIRDHRWNSTAQGWAE